MDENKQNKSYRFVYAVIEKGHGAASKTFWQKCGIAYVNRDQSINLYLDTLPLNGKLQIRDRDEERDRRFGNREAQEPAQAAAAAYDFTGSIQ